MAARINGPHSCGHPSKYLAESNAARAMIAQWATEECWHCQRTARTIAAIRTAHELGLPDLKGSEKQVPWAMSIREDARVMLSAYTEAHPTLQDMAATEAVLYGITDADWWIDRQDWAADQLVGWVMPLITITLGYRGIAA